MIVPPVFLSKINPSITDTQRSENVTFTKFLISTNWKMKNLNLEKESTQIKILTPHFCCRTLSSEPKKLSTGWSQECDQNRCSLLSWNIRISSYILDLRYSIWFTSQILTGRLDRSSRQDYQLNSHWGLWARHGRSNCWINIFWHHSFSATWSY